MRKILILFFLTSCSFNSNSNYWNESIDTDYQGLDYEKDYSINEYREILDKYNDKTKTPKIN